MEEIWKDILGFESFYQISTFGRVRNIKTNKMKKPYLSKVMYPYPTVGLWKKGIGINKFLHRLVAEAFINNPNKKPQINHKDGNKNNPHVLNLEWITPSENRRHAHETGLCNYLFGDDCSWSKISEIQLLEVKALILSGVSYGKIARKFNMSPSMISFIARGERRLNANLDITYDGSFRKKVAMPIVDQYGTVYNSITEAGFRTKASIGNIHSVLTGKRKTSKGFKFKFLKEEDNENF